MRRLGVEPKTTKLADVKKVGVNGEDVVRCRLVARDFKKKGEKNGRETGSSSEGEKLSEDRGSWRPWRAEYS